MQNDIIELCARFPMERIHRDCYPMISRYGGIYDFDNDDFFSIANKTVYECALSYDKSKGDFDLFVLGSFKKKFKTEMTRRNRKKRIQPANMDRLDDEDIDGNSIGEKIPSDFNIEDNIEEFNDDGYTDRIRSFMSGISKKNKPIAELIMQGYRTNEILEMRKITMKEYNDAITEFKAYRNVIKLINK